MHFAKRLFTLLSFALVSILLSGPALAQSPTHISFTLEACRNNGTITLPDANGFFLCPNEAYTTGNLGKGWAELDLVPHRLTTNSGNQADVSTEYQVAVAGDAITSNKLGWDVIGGIYAGATEPTVTGDASCSAVWGPQSMLGSSQDPFGGGTDTVIYRILTIHQAKNTMCQINWVQRLALGAHMYPGSSLQSYMAETTDLSGSKKTLSIPVNELLPQSLAKDMTAIQLAGSGFSWGLTSGTNPATLSFPDTCDPNNPTNLQLSVTLSWQKVPGSAGNVQVTTHIYVTNPAARSITVQVTDTMYNGSVQMHDPLQSAPMVVPPNTANLLVMTHTDEVSPTSDTNYNDVATAEYTDIVTGVPVPGQTKTTASTTVQPFSGTPDNDTATITNAESLDNNIFTFSVDSMTPVIGAFQNGYVPGTETTGPVDWNSGSQGASGEIELAKTFYVHNPSSGQAKMTDDTALNGSSGFSAAAAITPVVISSSATVSVTINKTVDYTPIATSFDFGIYDPQNQMVKSATIAFSVNQTNGSTTVTGLQPGVQYTVKEVANPSYTTDGDKSVTVTLPSCSNSVSFANTLQGQDLTVTKTAVPAFDRAYEWNITKAVDKDKWVSTTSVSPNYTVGVTQTGVTDSNWKLTGVITVNNPNPFDVSGVNVTDPGCTVTDGTSLAIAANGSANVNYSCSMASGASGINTATVTWSGIGSPNTSATATADYTFTTPTGTTNKVIHVTDTLGGTLGTVTASDTEPYATRQFQYTHTITAPASGCSNTPNTASITETGQEAKQSVEVCAPTQIVLKKYTRGGVGTFTFPVNGPTPLVQTITTQGTPDGYGAVSATVEAGTYRVSENPQNGWLLTDFVCDAGAVSATNPITGVPSEWTFTLQIGKTVTCTFTNSGALTTRTQGFWATHTTLSNSLWNGALTGTIPVLGSEDAKLCTTPITAIALPGANQLMGGFWSSISKTSRGRARSGLDKVRMQMLQQYLAAVLNYHMFGSGSSTMLANARNVYCHGTAAQVQAQIGLLGTFNSQGDSQIFTPGMSATSQASKSQANIQWWDTTVH